MKNLKIPFNSGTKFISEGI